MLYRQMIKNVRSGVLAFWHVRQKLTFLALLLAFPSILSAAPSSTLSNAVVTTLNAGVTAEEIQKTLDLMTNGGVVVLPSGKIKISEPLILHYNNQTLRGAAGQATTLYLANNAN